MVFIKIIWAKVCSVLLLAFDVIFIIHKLCFPMYITEYKDWLYLLYWGITTDIYFTLGKIYEYLYVPCSSVILKGSIISLHPSLIIYLHRVGMRDSLDN